MGKAASGQKLGGAKGGERPIRHVIGGGSRWQQMGENDGLYGRGVA